MDALEGSLRLRADCDPSGLLCSGVAVQRKVRVRLFRDTRESFGR